MNNYISNLGSVFLGALSLPAIAVPIAAFLVIVLRRRNLTGVIKVIALLVAILLLGYSIYTGVLEHWGELGRKEIFSGTLMAIVTYFVLSKFGHKHYHDQEENGAIGVVISEAMHSIVDGAVIGAAYLASPVIGVSATVGILSHELPKIIGTLLLFKSMNLSNSKVIIYGSLSQIGSPAAAIIVYFFFAKIIDHESLKSLEIAGLSSLTVIILYILFLEYRHHKHFKSHRH